MFVVSIRYPRKKGQEFNLQHWREVHMPKGMAPITEPTGLRPYGS